MTSAVPVLSVVVPVRDERDSLVPLHRELDAALASLGGPVELIFVDDGSEDGSLNVLRALEAKDPAVRVLPLGERRGQSAALAEGFRAARAPLLATLDADLQNDPADIPRLLEHLGDADVVNGVRVGRLGRDSWARILVSTLANAVRNRLTRETVTDVGCSLRVMRAEFVQRIQLERGMHRFLPTLLRLEGARLTEVPVAHRPRRYGVSKYGVFDRLWQSLGDLRTVRRMQRAARRATPESLS
ncbi:MAG: glycosyltransferase family 2 protein [Proteobacteria bacterium]|nr:glycosyltransferase family 2 protein [Pseudomonadota bacterium]